MQQSFVLLKRNLSLIGLTPYPNHGKAPIIVARCIYFTILSYFIASTTWFLIFDAKELIEYTDCFYFNFCAWNLSVWYLIYSFRIVQYMDMIDELDAIINKRSRDPSVKLYYGKTINQIEKITNKVFLWLCKIIVPGLWFISIIIVELIYKLSTDPNEFKLPYPAAFPFDTRTPLGYFIAGSIQVATNTAVAPLIAISLMLHSGFCKFLHCFLLDLKEQLRQLNQNYTSKTSEAELERKLHDIIRFHFDARHFIKRYSNVNGSIIFVYLTYSVICNCCLLSQINATVETNDYNAFSQYLTCLIIGIGLLFAFCHYGNKVTEGFEDLADNIYQLDWDVYPLNVQKKLQLMIAISQKTMYVEGYFGTRCTLVTFQKIINSTFKYFTFLRSFN